MAWDNATVFGGYERGVACADTLTVFGGDLVGGAGLHALALADAEDVAGSAFFYTFVVFPINFIIIIRSTFDILFARHADSTLDCRSLFRTGWYAVSLHIFFSEFLDEEFQITCALVIC